MQYVVPFVLAMVVTVTGLPILVRLGARWLIIDQPGGRKVHTVPIPRVGGVAMTIGIFIAALGTIELHAQDRWFLVGAAILVVFGVMDDRFDLDYRIKLIGQFLAVGVVVIAGGVQVRTIVVDDWVILPQWVSLPLTICFLVVVTNAINLADGLDGLAGGTMFLCLCAVAILSSFSAQVTGAALALAFAGAVLGFLRFNTYPASVFMGDAGSQLLGFTVGVLSVRATQGETSQISAAIPVLLLAVPILDTLSVMVQRVSEGRSPFSPDKNHIHHKLLALGFVHHEAVMVIYVLQAALFVLAYFLRFESDPLILGVVTIFFILSIAVLQTAARCGWQLRRGAPAATNTGLPRLVAKLRAPEMLPLLAFRTIVVSLAMYAALIVFKTAQFSSDLRLLIIALLATAVGFLATLRGRPLSLAEKAVVYVTATVLVYLDAVVAAPDRLVSVLTWITVSVVAISTAIRLHLQNDRRFQLTPLDLIVLFMALVVPNLPGYLHLPQGGAPAIAKLAIVFYAVEVLVVRAEGKAAWVRIAATAVLTGLAVRPLMPF
jgi:UDP-GlcNAc:undecaprenyl-phosphate GlcNAc-1-phosphate transferase